MRAASRPTESVGSGFILRVFRRWLVVGAAGEKLDQLLALARVRDAGELHPRTRNVRFGIAQKPIEPLAVLTAAALLHRARITVPDTDGHGSIHDLAQIRADISPRPICSLGIS